MALVLAVVPFRQTWAWWIAVVLQGFGAASVLGGTIGVLPFLDALLLFLILVSPQMRDWVGVNLGGSTRGSAKRIREG